MDDTADRSGQPFSGYHRLLDAREDVELTHVPREQNTEADALVNAALDLA